MSASGDLKSGDPLFSTTLLQEFQPRPPSRKIDPVPNGNDLDIIRLSDEVLHELLSKFAIIVLMPELESLSVTKYVQNAPETVPRIRKIQVMC